MRFTPPSPKSHTWWPIHPASLEQFLRAIWGAVFWAAVLTLPQIKLKLQHLCGAFFKVDIGTKNNFIQRHWSENDRIILNGMNISSSLPFLLQLQKQFIKCGHENKHHFLKVGELYGFDLISQLGLWARRGRSERKSTLSAFSNFSPSLMKINLGELQSPSRHEKGFDADFWGMLLSGDFPLTNDLTFLVRQREMINMLIEGPSV